MVFTRSIDESEWYVSIAGVKNVQVKNVDELIENVRKVAYNHYFQLFDAEKIAGWEHIYHGAINAVRSFQSGSAISKSLDMVRSGNEWEKRLAIPL